MAPWGELLSTASRARNAAGCVTDGLVRDVRTIRGMRFPVFAGGIGPLDSKGRGIVMRIDIPVECGGDAVASGDWIFGDVDGVVVIPAAIAEEVITLRWKRSPRRQRCATNSKPANRWQPSLPVIRFCKRRSRRHLT